MKKKIESDLSFVPNSSKYYEFIRNLRNNPSATKGFINQEYIGKDQQKAYMKKYQNNYFLCLYGGQPTGYVGIIERDIRIAVHPKFQGKGIGLFLIKNIMEKYPMLQAKIKVENKPSLNLFKKAGFEMKYYIFEYNKMNRKV